jgi:hypothetical protein
MPTGTTVAVVPSGIWYSSSMFIRVRSVPLFRRATSSTKPTCTPARRTGWPTRRFAPHLNTANSG